MNCQACADFDANHGTGSVQKDCTTCQAREIANGQPFYESRTGGSRTRRYMAQLENLFGWDGLEAGHKEVKRLAGLIQGVAA